MFIFDTGKNSTKPNKETYSYKTGTGSGTSGGRVTAQFVPGHVVTVITSTHHSLYKKLKGHLGEGSSMLINAIQGKSHYPIGGNNVKFENDSLDASMETIYIPLFRGIADVPTQGDPVLLCNFDGINYYIGPLNTINNPNQNPDISRLGNHVNKSSMPVGDRSLFNISPALVWKNGGEIKRLEKPVIMHMDTYGFYNKGTRPNNDQTGIPEKAFNIPDNAVGDLILEGRFGNSIRIGQRSKFPNIIISNGRPDLVGSETLMDSTLISITKVGKIYDNFAGENLFLASNQKENKRHVAFKDTPNSQILISSNKITFNSREKEITLSAFGSVNIGSNDNCRIYTNNSTIIESKNIYLGEKAEEKVEPLVMGAQLKKILEQVCTTIDGLTHTVCVAGGTSGPPPPGSTEPIRSMIKNMLSDKHYIEPNGSKD